MLQRHQASIVRGYEHRAFQVQSFDRRFEAVNRDGCKAEQGGIEDGGILTSNETVISDLFGDGSEGSGNTLSDNLLDLLLLMQVKVDRSEYGSDGYCSNALI